MLFGGSGKNKIETADDLIKAFKGEPGEPGCEGNGIIDIIKDDEDNLIFKMLYGQEIIIENVKGDKGDKGSPGKDGLNGKDGKDGKDGLNGLTGEKGEKGDAGEKGEKGEKGEPGKDAPLSKWVSIQELEFTTDSEEFDNVAVVEAGGDKLFTVKIFIEAKAEGTNGWFVSEKAFVINVDKQSINSFSIIPDQKTHDQFSFDLRLVNLKPVLVAKALKTKTEWKARLEVYAL